MKDPFQDPVMQEVHANRDQGERSWWWGMLAWVAGAILLAAILIAAGFVGHAAYVLLHLGWNLY